MYTTQIINNSVSLASSLSFVKIKNSMHSENNIQPIDIISDNTNILLFFIQLIKATDVSFHWKLNYLDVRCYI